MTIWVTRYLWSYNFLKLYSFLRVNNQILLQEYLKDCGELLFLWKRERSPNSPAPSLRQAIRAHITQPIMGYPDLPNIHSIIKPSFVLDPSVHKFSSRGLYMCEEWAISKLEMVWPMRSWRRQGGQHPKMPTCSTRIWQPNQQIMYQNFRGLQRMHLGPQTVSSTLDGGTYDSEDAIKDLRLLQVPPPNGLVHLLFSTAAIIIRRTSNQC